MATRAGLNKNNSAVKRIMQEARELANDPCTDYTAAPLEDDIFEWHCTLRGPAGTEFDGGVYHFRILLPSEYPFRPPSIMMLTPNGRFELNTKICISFTNYHEELWQPAWGVRTAIIGLQGMFPLKGTAAVGVGAIEYPVTERKRLAALSRDWVCPKCQQSNLECLPDPPAAGASSAAPVETSSKPGELPASALPSSPSIQTPTPADPVTIHVVAPTPIRPTNPTIVSEYTNPLVSASPSPSQSTPPISRPETSQDVPTRPSPIHASRNRSPRPRPPLLLDTAICVLLVLMFALICRRFL